MQDRRKVVIERNTRHLASTPPKSVTPNQTPFLNPYGMSSAQINRMNKAVSNKRTGNKPQQVVRTRATSPEILLAVPAIGAKFSVEYPMPDWFKSTDNVDVSIIVPLYKSDAVVRDLIHSWSLQNTYTWEIIFVDDACPNNSKEAVLQSWNQRRAELTQPIGRIIVNVENKGYGLACNTGAEYAKGKYLIFLNADTTVTEGWIEPIVRLLKNEDVGIVGNLQIKEGGTWDGTIDGAGSEWSWKKECFEHIGRHSYHREEIPQPMKPENAPKDVMSEGEREMVTGCCFGIRKDLFQHIGGFNANYRIGYWEDAELNLFVRELGYKVMFTPHSKIYHKLSHTHSAAHPFHQFNRLYFHNRWLNSGRIDSLVGDKRQTPHVHSILLRRSGAHGDVLVAAGVASALKKKHNNCQILFLTDCPSVIKGHPYIDRIITHDEVSERLFQVFYDLDMVYEYRPYANILTAYAQCVGVKTDDCDICISTEALEIPSGCIAIHAGRTLWSGRNWLPSRFAEVAERLRNAGHQVICVGGKDDALVPCDFDLRGNTNIGQLAHVLQQCKFFVGIDSLPMHVAQAVNTPGVCFFGSITPKHRLYRDNMNSITADLPCLGCHHRRPAPCIFTNVCETGGEDCINKITVDMMMTKIENTPGYIPPEVVPCQSRL